VSPPDSHVGGARAPVLFVVLGATGDLATRKLVPAVARLHRHFEAGFEILGVSRGADFDGDAGFRRFTREALTASGASAEELDRWDDDCLHYLAIGEARPEDYRRLAARIDDIERAAGLPGNRVFYLALPPTAFPDAVRGMGEAGLSRSDGWTRLVIEKPFGVDLDSACELNRIVHRWFDESQVYRIDHYLGKETVQNLLVFRFSNALFESVWNRERVASVQITVAEDRGIGGRGGYYDRSGALRDMVQNHLTQVASLIAMEVPIAYEADAVRFEKVKALRAVQPIDPARVVLGQYTAGEVGGAGGGADGGAGGERVPGYLDEERVAPGSTTETFAALDLAFDSWRWQGVPFYLRTGKRLPRRVTEIAVVFRRPPVALFKSLHCRAVDPNVLLITLQPDEGFALYVAIKRPGEPLAIEDLPLRFGYQQAFGELPEAYETLLLDVVTGDQTLFVHADEVEASWRLYTPLLDAGLLVHPYPAGSWGPEEADRLLARDGHRWRTR
jgi:glucose-6-phosphate 1-dehydrogenase